MIVPLLKSGKPSGALKLYRPVSLTPCVVKLMERLIAERMYHIMETGNCFTVWRQRLLISMHDQGILLQIIRWVASFLDNRQAKVRFGDGIMVMVS